jgi:hypothetical protein
MLFNQPIGRIYLKLKPSSNIPSSRDDDIDGTWEAPRVDNPLCKDAPGCGIWSSPMVPNPAHRGIWRAPLVDNPNYRVCQYDFLSSIIFNLIFRVYGKHVKFQIPIISKKLILTN